MRVEWKGRERKGGAETEKGEASGARIRDGAEFIQRDSTENLGRLNFIRLLTLDFFTLKVWIVLLTPAIPVQAKILLIFRFRTRRNARLGLT